MFRILVLGLTMALPSVAFGQTKAIRFGRAWDGARVVADAVVVIEGDRIVRVGIGARTCRRGRR
jgi:hypothetical protein